MGWALDTAARTLLQGTPGEQPYFLYKIEFPNGKKYIGICKDLSARRRSHRYSAMHRRRSAVHHAIHKYGPDLFRLEPIVVGPKSYVIDLERTVIAAYQTTNRKFGYNISVGGESPPMSNPDIAAKMKATKNTKEFKDKIVGQKRPERSLEWRKKLSLAAASRKRHPHSEETKEKMRIATLGQRHTPETRAKLSAIAKARAKR